MSSPQNDLFEITDDEAEQIARYIEALDDPDVKRKWPQSLADMLDVAAAVLRRELPDAEQAERLAAKVVVAAARYHGGRLHYLPTNESLDLAVRDRTLFWRWMRGQASPTELANEYGITYTRVMQILAEQRALWRTRHAPQLPGMTESEGD